MNNKWRRSLSRKLHCIIKLSWSILHKFLFLDFYSKKMPIPHFAFMLYVMEKNVSYSLLWTANISFTFKVTILFTSKYCNRGTRIILTIWLNSSQMVVIQVFLDRHVTGNNYKRPNRCSINTIGSVVDKLIIRIMLERFFWRKT